MDLADGLAVSVSQGAADPEWDAFVLHAPGGRHEQTSMWGQVKAVEGWRPIRGVLRRDGKIVAGFQMLSRALSPFGLAAYATKAPLLADGCPGLVEPLSQALHRAVKEYCVSALIVNPPLGGNYTTDHLKAAGFHRNHLVNVKDATYEIDLQQDIGHLLQRMRQNRRKNIRKGLRGNRLSFHEGDEAELKIFYGLMCETCRRQGVAPNPGWEALSRMWRLFHHKGYLRMFLATLDGEYVSGILVIPFGERAFFWKTGWSGSHGKLHPNDMLHWEIMQWAKRRGHRFMDFVGIESWALESNSASKHWPPYRLKSSSFYKMGFGGRVVRLPASYIYIPHPAQRMIYALAFSSLCRRTTSTAITAIRRIRRRCKR